MTLYTSLLSQISEHIQLTAKEKEEFISVLTEKRITRKKFLIKPEADVDYMYYVVQGCLKAYYLDEAGNKHIIQFAIEHWWITDFDALFNRIPAQLYIEAIEDCVLLGLHLNIREELYLHIPKFERFFRILHTQAFVALQRRVISSLQKNNKERYIEFCTQYPNIEKRVTNYHIANYLGMQPETLSRIRKEIATST